MHVTVHLVVLLLAFAAPLALGNGERGQCLKEDLKPASVEAMEIMEAAKAVVYDLNMRSNKTSMYRLRSINEAKAMSLSFWRDADAWLLLEVENGETAETLQFASLVYVQDQEAFVPEVLSIVHLLNDDTAPFLDPTYDRVDTQEKLIQDAFQAMLATLNQNPLRATYTIARMISAEKRNILAPHRSVVVGYDVHIKGLFHTTGNAVEVWSSRILVTYGRAVNGEVRCLEEIPVARHSESDKMAPSSIPSSNKQQQRLRGNIYSATVLLDSF